MFVKVHKATKTPAADNKGSCLTLAQYLEKENAGKEPGDKMAFFNHRYDNVARSTAVAQIDNNHKNLSKSDNKFFMVSVNPSHHEMQHLIKVTTGREGITDFTQLTRKEQERVFVEMRNYTRKVMDVYAQNFDRPNVRDGGDLVYFAKIETMRKWHPWDREVRSGQAKAGELKPGLNVHVHVCVSRNDVTQTTKLSPESRSRGGKQQLNGKAVQQGFNHEAFKEKSGAAFRSTYNYKGYEKEQYNQRSGKSNQGRASTLLSRSMPNTNSVSGKAKQKIKDVVLQGQFKTETKIVKNIATAAAIIINPAAAVNIAKKKLISILKGVASSGNEI